MNKNIKVINLRLTEIGVQRFKTVPVFKDTLHNNQIKNLAIGDNKLSVSHCTYHQLKSLASNDNVNLKISESWDK